MAANSVLHVKGLQVSFGTATALKNISLEIPEKSVTAIVGPAGCGKSVFLKALNRLNELDGAKTTGEVLLYGNNIYTPEVEVALLRQRVGMVFQRPTAFNMSIYDNVAFGLRLVGGYSRAQLDAQVENALHATGLWEELRTKLRKNAFVLTRGQQQRLCIARVLAANPEVLLLDEPTAELDSICTMRTEELMRSVAASRSVVLATHSVHQAARVADNCAFLLDGALEEYSSAEKFFSSPSSPKAEAFVTGQLN